MKTLQVMDSPVARKAVEVGRANKRRFRPLAYADELEEPVFYNDWWYIPIAEDDSVIPSEARRRVDMLKAAEIEVTDLIVAHETPKLLMPPPGESEADKRKAKAERRKRQLKKAGKVAVLVGVALLAVFALVGLALVFAVVLAAAAAALVTVGILAAAVSVDPALIAVVQDEDGRKVWIEVATWYD